MQHQHKVKLLFLLKDSRGVKDVFDFQLFLYEMTFSFLFFCFFTWHWAQFTAGSTLTIHKQKMETRPLSLVPTLIFLGLNFSAVDFVNIKCTSLYSYILTSHSCLCKQISSCISPVEGECPCIATTTPSSGEPGLLWWSFKSSAPHCVTSAGPVKPCARHMHTGHHTVPNARLGQPLE